MSSENEGCLMSVGKTLFLFVIAIIAYGVAFCLEVVFFVPLLLIYILRQLFGDDKDTPSSMGCFLKSASEFVEEVAKENR